MFPHPIQSVHRVFQQNSQLLLRRPHREFSKIHTTTAAVIPRCDSAEKPFLPIRSRNDPAVQNRSCKRPRGPPPITKTEQKITFKSLQLSNVIDFKINEGHLANIQMGQQTC